MRKTYRVVDCTTEIPLDGKVTAALSREAEVDGNEEGIVKKVYAYLLKGAWYYVAPSEVESYKKDLGVEVKRVYVEEV